MNPSAATVKAPRVAAKGWTAFTAFGLHTRDAVRRANPGATSVEVEKVCTWKISAVKFYNACSNVNNTFRESECSCWKGS